MMEYEMPRTATDATIGAGSFPTFTMVTWANVLEMGKLEEDMKMIIKYDARGFSESDIEVTKEFHNKTKQLYLNIKGKIEIEEIQHKQEIDIRLPVDKDVYRGASWKLINGILVIILYEKKNPEPDFNVLYEE